MKIRDRINLYTTVLFILLLIIINGAVYYAFSHMMFASELERASAEAEYTVKGINHASAAIPADELLRAYVPINGMLQIVHADGKRGPAVTVPNHESLIDFPVTYFQKEEREIVEFNGIPHAFVSIPIVWNGGVIAALQVTESLKHTDDMLRILRVVLIMGTAIATIPVIMSSRLLSNFISRPITSMITTMTEIRKSGHFKRIPLPEKSKDELYQMGETFNNMIDLLEVNYEKQGQFISNASHELRTPLTIIESYAALLKRRGEVQPELLEESVQAIYSEAIRMKDLIEQLLLLANHESEWNVELINFELTGVVEELVQSFQKAYGREINLYAENEVEAIGDPQRFRQLVYILMDNARKYSDDIIEVRLKQENQKALVEISDRGIGIPAAELDKIFDRFYRVDKARSRKKGGFGLGLSLAKEIAEVMDSELQIESIEDHGTKVKIWLPLSSSQ